MVSEGEVRPYTTGERDMMARMWAEGRSAREIAEAVNRTETAVHKYADANRDLFPRRNVRLSDEEHEQMLALREQGKSYAEIGKYLGVSDETVRRHVRRERRA